MEHKEAWIRKLGWGKPPAESGETGRQIPLPGAFTMPPDAVTRTSRQGPNSVRTSRYTIWDFLPRQLFYQFSRLAHSYLLVVSILQLIPGLSTTGKLTTVIPLLIFLVLIIAKEGYYDWRRHRADVAENQRIAAVLGQAGHPTRPEWADSRWQDIKVGDIVKLKKDEEVPADIVLLHANGEDGVAYVDTMALDGETSLKRKSTPAGLPTCETIDKICLREELIVIEEPHANLYRFDGTIISNGERTPFGTEEVIYRGSTIRNTTETIGIVVLTGEECRVRMNAKKDLKPKKPALERTTNYIVVCLMFYVLLLAGLCTIAYFYWARWDESRAWYLSGANVPFEQIFLGFIIMFNQVIPLSLYIGLEAIKLGQMALITGDIQLYHEESDTPASVNSNNALDDLGQISYVFTDKTGTLTENIMNLSRFYIHGTSWLHQTNTGSGNGLQGVTEFGTTQRLLQEIRVNPSSPWSVKATRFLTAVAICHTCFPVLLDDGEVDYQGSSPDEVALVQAAKELGFIAVHKSSQSITLQILNENGEVTAEVFEILSIIDFSSDRKRMSIIVRCPGGQIWLICKGADTVVYPRLSSNHKQDLQRHGAKFGGNADRSPLNTMESSSDAEYMPGGEANDDAIPLCGIPNRNGAQEPSGVTTYQADYAQLRDHTELLSHSESIMQCKKYVDSYAAKGLRTLVYADRYLTTAEYESWKSAFEDAQAALQNRQERIAEVGEMIEQSFELLGASAVEDKLQHRVPETIESLRQANIKICMLTGDKRETAVNIARSSRICDMNTTIYEVDISRTDSLENQLAWIEQALMDPRKCQGCSAILVDGQTLTEIEEHSAASLRHLFYGLLALVDSVICCRASPSQKALLVTSVSNGPSTGERQSMFQRLASWFMPSRKPLTLAIGDGANDVAMILTANVGVGISGREGQQAARVADVSISQFRFLARLMLVHGRHNYHRTTMFILTTFWKEIFIYFPQALFQDKVGVTGTSLYYPSSLIFVSFLTAASMVVIGTWEQDLEASTLMAVPKLYAYGQRGEGMNLRAFLGWVLNAFFAGIVAFQVPWIGYAESGISNETGLFAQGELTFIICIIWINCKILLLEMHTKTKIALWSVLCSVSGLWVYELIISLIQGQSAGPYSVKGGLIATFGRDPIWWLCMIWVLGFLFFFETALKACKQNVLVRNLVARCLPFLGRGNGGGVRRGFKDWETRLWQEIEQNTSIARKLEIMAEELD